ncbi:MAG: ammonium transporter, partial [Comamonadaceae bacterium]
IGTPVAVFGCLPFGVTGAGIGAIVGTIAVGGPTLIVAGIDLLTTLNAPPGTTKWSE